MGEAKRRRLTLMKSACICGSSRRAVECCYRDGEWCRAPADLGLRRLPPGTTVAKCYMRELGSCEGGISREHLISEGVIRILKSEGDFSVSGLPWLEAGETKILEPGNLTANCLCRRHNSALSPLDDAAVRFFAALRSGLEREAYSGQALISGHDIERWLLKTAKALAASRNLTHGGERLSGVFASDIGVVDLLDDPGRWPENAGLYCVMPEGATTENHLRFQLQPLTNNRGEISGLEVNIMGIRFLLLWEALDLARNPDLQRAKYRPGAIKVSYLATTFEIVLSWKDRGVRHETLNLQFMRPAT